jgi:hypothetical protein
MAIMKRKKQGKDVLVRLNDDMYKELDKATTLGLSNSERLRNAFIYWLSQKKE